MLGFIIYLSLENGDESTASSNRVGTAIANFLNFFGASIDPNNQEFKMIVRKLVGHFGLFCGASLISVFSILCLKHKYKEKLIVLITSIILGIRVAFLTEFFQGLTDGRGPSIKDSFIDILGYFLPILIYLFFEIFVIFKGKRREKMLEL